MLERLFGAAPEDLKNISLAKRDLFFCKPGLPYQEFALSG